MTEATDHPNSDKATGRHWTLCLAREYVDDWERTRSIIWMMHEALRAALEETKDNDVNKLEVAVIEAEAFMLNVDWLADRMDRRGEKLREEFKEVGIS